MKEMFYYSRRTSGLCSAGTCNSGSISALTKQRRGVRGREVCYMLYATNVLSLLYTRKF